MQIKQVKLDKQIGCTLLDLLLALVNVKHLSLSQTLLVQTVLESTESYKTNKASHDTQISQSIYSKILIFLINLSMKNCKTIENSFFSVVLHLLRTQKAF